MGFKSILALSHIKVAQTRFVFHETWHKTRFCRYYCVEVVRIVNYSLILNITW